METKFVLMSLVLPQYNIKSGHFKQSKLAGVNYFIQQILWQDYRMASLLDGLIFDAVYDS